MAQTKRFLVYVASNHEDLEFERYEVERQLVRMGMMCCGFPCRDDNSPYDWNLCRSQIEDADLFILIVGDKYEPMAPTGISYLHRELVHAQTLSKPVLAFVKNSLPATAQTEDQRRLAGFHRVIAKGSYRLWHLREELISHVKTGVVNALSNKTGGWMKLPSGAVGGANSPAERGESTDASDNKEDTKKWLTQARQQVMLKFTAKVYEAGNNTLQEIAVSQSWGVLFSCVAETMKTYTREEVLRQALASLVEPEVSGRMLKYHPVAHAVDDIRVNKGQFQGFMDECLALGLVTQQRKAGRIFWQLSPAGQAKQKLLQANKKAV